MGAFTLPMQAYRAAPQPMTFPAPLERFATLFNQAAYWESHEVLERPWRQGRSGFYKGLILYASAWVHAQRGNRRGVEAQLRKARNELAQFAPAYLGVDVQSLLAHVAACQDHLPAVHAAEALLPPPPLELSTSRVRGDEPELALPDLPG